MNCLDCGPDNGLNLHHKEAHLELTEANNKQEPPRQREAEMVLWVGSSQLPGICPVDLTCLPLQSEVAQSCPTLCDPMDCSLPGPLSRDFPGQTQIHVRAYPWEKQGCPLHNSPCRGKGAGAAASSQTVDVEFKAFSRRRVWKWMAFCRWMEPRCSARQSKKDS